jgi:hypothetical protein
MTARPPPRIVCVPAPVVPRGYSVLGRLAGVGPLLVSGTVVWRWVDSDGVRAWRVPVLFLIGAALLAQTALIVLRWRCRNQHADAIPDALARELARRWRPLGRPPTTRAVLRAIRATSADAGPGALLVLLGLANEPPHTGDLRFPLQILPWRSPLDQIARSKAATLVALVLILALLPFANHLFAALTAALVGAGLLIMFVSSVVTWSWRGLIAARYVRLAPGLVQLVRSTPWRRTLTIKSFPLESGTIIIVAAGCRDILFTFRRPGARDALRLSDLPRGEEAAAYLWSALLSTTPTPPLSETELAG